MLCVEKTMLCVGESKSFHIVADIVSPLICSGKMADCRAELFSALGHEELNLLLIDAHHGFAKIFGEGGQD